MNVKKMFASLTGVLMLASAVTPMVTGAANYSDELKGAYEYAYSKNITTMSSIDGANMYGELTRGQLAKMIANWAEKENGTKVDETAVCSFADANTAEGDLAAYVKKACQMGLMGQGVDNFRPNDKVTRGEFGTTLSRALWGDKYNGGTPFYKNHLEALKEAKIMMKIDTPNQMEIRGFVMLMLQRSAEVVTPAECKDAAVILACALNGENCPAACKKAENKPEVVGKAGDLQVTATPATERKVILGAVSDLDTIRFKADQSISLEKVVLERYGYSSADDIEAVWLEDENGTRITNERSLNSKDEVSLNVNRDYRMLDKDDLVTIVVQARSVASGAKVGGTLGFKVKEIMSSAKNLDITKYTPYQYDMVEYKGTDVSVEVKGKGKTYHYQAKEAYEVSRLQVKATNAAVLVKGFTLTNDPADNKLDIDRYVDKVEVLVDGKAVEGLKSEVKRDEITVNFNDVKVEMRKNATFVVKVSFKDLDRFGNKVTLKLKNTSDINAVESKTKARVAVKSLPTSWNTYVFNWGQIKLTNTKLPATVDAAAGSSDVVIGEGKIELEGEAIKLNNFTVVAAQTGIDSMKFVIGNEDYEATRNTAGTGFLFKNVVIEKSEKVQFKVELFDAATGTINVTSTFDRNLLKAGAHPNEYVGEYDESREKIALRDFVGSVNLSNVKVQPAKGSLTNNLTKEVEFLDQQTARKVVFDGEYVAQKQNVTLNEIAIKELSSKPLSGDDNVVFYVSINGSEVGSIDLDGAVFEGSDVISDIEVKKGEKVSVKVEANVYAKASYDYTYTLTLKGEDKDGNPAGIASADTVKMKTVTAGSVIVSDDSTANRNTVVLRSSNVNLAKFYVKSSNSTEGTTLESFEMALTDDANGLTTDKFRVRVDGTELTADSDFEVAAATLKVKNLSEDIATNPVLVEVFHKNELAVGKYTLTLNKVNNATPTKKFTKKVVNALVTVKAQENVGNAETKYTFKVEKFDDSVNVTDLKLFYSNGAQQAGGASATLASVADGDTLEVANLDSVKYIDKVTYNDGAAVEITKADFRDYFRVGNTFAKIFKAE